ncbi:endoplasmic reticulum oxidoreductin 1 [Helicosporidium sp. ATCC 50920]|nr:endoplasmic reticulum oxidoreductin 1 [Helicosporidium sp. ATCC 50920]|eukprot:KDD75221.1 endoplasmic reticulum oxidoreductin 1 [Helicosporidium sp. ATCC 50920]
MYTPQRLLQGALSGLDSWLPGRVTSSACTCEDTESASLAASTCRGSPSDCCCERDAVERVNGASVAPLLSELVSTAFFRYFKVDLACDCPFWPDDGMCSLRHCSVCECAPGEVPALWLRSEQHSSVKDPVPGAEDKEPCEAVEQASELDRSIPSRVRAKLLAVPDWRGWRNPWMPETDEGGEAAVEYAYINLGANPERYTGYKGEHAHRVWNAIYSQPCFFNLTLEEPAGDLADSRHEHRVFYKLVSGVHASISAHLSADYLLDAEADAWGPSLEQFRARLGSPAVAERVQNLHFAYLFVLRALAKAEPILRAASYDTGMPEEDARTERLVQRLLDVAELRGVCAAPFDEGRLWRGEGGPRLKRQLQGAFRNITRVMDCVGCEKCKMWGKLQFLGIATSLKILFWDDECELRSKEVGGGKPGFGLPAPLAQVVAEPSLADSDEYDSDSDGDESDSDSEDGPLPPSQPPPALLPALERNEVIALVNLLERLSKSVEIVRRMSEMLLHAEPHALETGAGETLRG